MTSRTNTQFVIASLTEFVAAWQRGLDGSLSFTSSGGHLSVNFSCNLGLPGENFSLPTQAPPAYHPPPPPAYQPPLPKQPRHCGPAQREKNRLRAARHQASGNAASAPCPSSAPPACFQAPKAASPAPSAAPPAPATPSPTATPATTSPVVAPSLPSSPVTVSSLLTAPVNSPSTSSLPSTTGTRPRTCTRCGQPSKGHLGPCGERCQVKGAPESLRAAPPPDVLASMPPIKDTREEEPEFGFISCDYCDATTENWETEKHSICHSCKSTTVVWDYSQPPRILGICIQCTGISTHSYYGY